MEHAMEINIPEDLEPDQEEMLRKLLEGKVDLLKFGMRGAPHKRTFTLTPDMHLSWDSSWKPRSRTQVDLSKVDRVQTGQSTKKFSRYADKHRDVMGHSLSLIYDDQLSSLDLVASSDQEANTLIGLLNRLIPHVQDEKTMEDAELKNFRQQWRKADKDGSGTLDRKEIVRLVQKLNITASSSYIKEQMKAVDFNGDGVLQFKEFVFLMRFLGERPEVEALFLTLLRVGHEPDPSRALARCLTEDQMTEPPTEPEKLRLRQEMMPMSTFALFLREVQGEDVSDERVAELATAAKSYSHFPSHGTDNALSYRAFFNYIGSVEDNSPVDKKTLSDVYQDMNQPLSHYYIASSHNTYLEGDQLQSNSSVNRYINDLCKGCRCVELDCWDGDDGEPLIYHGYTLTGRIRFEDVIQAVKDYAFKATDYPVILSLENHCSLPQQQKMSQHMIRIIGDTMAVLPELGEGDPLPSPESLRGKIIIKGKVVREGEEYADSDEDEDEEEQTLEAKKSGKMSVPRNAAGPALGAGSAAGAEQNLVKKTSREGLPPPAGKKVKARDRPPPQKTDATPVKGGRVKGHRVPRLSFPRGGSRGGGDRREFAMSPPFWRKGNFLARGVGAVERTTPVRKQRQAGRCEGGSIAEDPTPPPPRTLSAAGNASAGSTGSASSGGSWGEPKRRGSKSKEDKKKKIHPELSAITFLAGVKFHGFENAKQSRVNDMSAFGETKTEKLLKKSPEEWVMYNARNMSRIYPAGSRVDSSNYDPVPSWNVGSQIVALNYQTPGTSMQLNDGLFRDNGGCGYLLKPECLRSGKLFHPESGPFPPGGITLTVQVVSGRQLPKPGGAQQGEIIDPYVIVSVHGIPVDCKKGKSTKVIQDNGFNPIWNETITFEITMPDMALLMFTVMDKDVKADDFIAQTVVPVKNVKKGYRSLRLYSSKGTQHGDFEHASLLCRFIVTPTG